MSTVAATERWQQTGRVASRRRWPLGSLLVVAISWLLAAAIIGPLVIVVMKSFQNQLDLFTTAYTLQKYADLFSSSTLTALGNSLEIAIGVMLFSLFWGVALAWIVVRTDVPFAKTLDSINLVPFFLSPLIGAMAWSYLASPTVGLLNKSLQAVLPLGGPPFNIYTLPGIIWVAGLNLVPFAYLFCSASLRQADPSLETAAQICGSNRLVTMARVTLPLATPALMSSAMLCFIMGLEDLSTPLILGRPHGVQTISTAIYERIMVFPNDYNFGAAMGCLLMVFTAAAILIQRRVVQKRSYVTVTGRGYRPDKIRLGRMRYAALAIDVAYLLCSVVLPLGALLIVSLSHAWLGYIDLSQFSLEHYVYLFWGTPLVLRSIWNSLQLATLGATLTMILSVVVVYAITRMRIAGRGFLEVVIALPIGIPGLVFAVGLLEGLIRTPLYATLGIILIGYSVRFGAYGQRNVLATLSSIGRELEEASRTAGAGGFTTSVRVLLPLLRPGLAAGWLLLFITFMREVSMSMLLSRAGTETMSVGLFNLLNYDPGGSSAAFTLIQVIILLAGATIFLRVAGKESVQV